MFLTTLFYTTLLILLKSTGACTSLSNLTSNLSTLLLKLLKLLFKFSNLLKSNLLICKF